MRDPSHFVYFFRIVIVSSVTVAASSSVLDNAHYVGCYDIGYSFLQKYHHHLPDVTLTNCVEYCLELKTRFAGIKTNENACFCGGDIAEGSVKRTNSICNIPCPDGCQRTCGGDWTLSLYDILGANVTDANDTVDILLGVPTGVRLYHSKNVSTYETLMTVFGRVDSVDYHFRKSKIYFYYDNKIYEAPLQSSGKSISPPLFTAHVVKEMPLSSVQCEGFAVDWVHDRIFWADCNMEHGTEIKAAGLDGEGEQTLLWVGDIHENKTIRRMEVDPYKGAIFWTETTEHHWTAIESCGLDGEEFTDVTKRGVFLWDMALDIKQRRIYYVEYSENALFSVDYSGDDEVKHFSMGRFRSIPGLGIMGDNLFWVNHELLGNVIYQAPITLTKVKNEKKLQTMDKMVRHMRLVHPSLQSHPDPCLEKGCAYRCVASGVSATCECPPGRTLSYDGHSCRKGPEKDSKFNKDPVILLTGSGGIYLYNASESHHKLKTVISHVGYPVVALDYHLRRREGYAIWNDYIYRFPLFEDEPLKTNQIVNIAEADLVSTFAVDWVHNVVFWPARYYSYSRLPVIRKIDIRSEKEESVVRIPDYAWVLDMVVDPYKGFLFWTTGTSLMSCQLDGQKLKKIVPDFPINQVSSLSLDLVGETVSCAGLSRDNTNTSILYVSHYTGRRSFSFDFQQYKSEKRILSFGLIDHSGYFYLKAPEDNYSYLMFTDLNPDEKPTIYLKEKDLQLTRFRLIHPRLQAPPKVDACTFKGCAHSCVIEDSIPRCDCPWNFMLANDNKTCVLNPKEGEDKPLRVKVALGLMLVLLVVTGAAVLMYLCDKLWTQLHPAVVRLGAPSNAQSSSTGRRMTGDLI